MCRYLCRFSSLVFLHPICVDLLVCVELLTYNIVSLTPNNVPIVEIRNFASIQIMERHVAGDRHSYGSSGNGFKLP